MVIPPNIRGEEVRLDIVFLIFHVGIYRVIVHEKAERGAFRLD
jgi:hypothetical protein